LSTIQQLVDNLGSGWKIVGSGNPVEETVVAQVPSTQVPGEMETVNRGTGNYYVTVQDPDGHQRALFMKAQPIRGGLNVRQSGINDQGDNAKDIFTGDLKNLQWDQSKPVGDVPQEPKTPSNAQDLQKIGSNGQVIAAGDTTTKPVKLYDPKTGQSYDIPAGTQPVLHELGNDLLLVQPDGTFSVVTSKPDKPTTTTVAGIGVVTIDPSKPAGQRVTVDLPEDKSAKASQYQPREINGTMYVAADKPGGGGIVWQEAKDENGDPLPSNVTWTAVSNDARSSQIQLIGSNGETKTIPKADFHAPPSPAAGQALTPDTTAPYVVTIGDNGLPVFTDNTNRISITDATRQFIDSLGTHVAAGSMSEAQAQDLIKNITAGMTARATAQNAQANALQGMAQATTGQLNAISQGAQTGAGILQNRVTAATGALQNLVGQAAGAKNLMSVPAGLGEQLVGGLQGWATQLGGGQDVYDSAANLVKRADPGNALGGDAATAYSALGQMLQKYRDLTGQPHPAEAIANQPQGDTGFTAPIQSNPMPNTSGPVQPIQSTPMPFGAIGNNPMLNAQQMYNRYQAGQQLQAATAQAGLPFTSPMTIAPPAATVTV